MRAEEVEAGNEATLFPSMGAMVIRCRKLEFCKTLRSLIRNVFHCLCFKNNATQCPLLIQPYSGSVSVAGSLEDYRKMWNLSLIL